MNTEASNAFADSDALRLGYRMFLLALVAGAVTSCRSITSEPIEDLVPRYNESAGAVKYVNGNWYADKDGVLSFVQGDRYAKDGVLTEKLSGDYTTINLQGRYIVPPFGEAHNHSVEGVGTEKNALQYLAEGAFYYKNANGVYSSAKPLLDYWRRPDTLDVSFSFAGLSKDEGHPEKLYRTLKGYGMYPDIDIENLDGNAFYDVNSMEKLDKRWAEIIALKPDFLKLYLLEHDTEESAGLSADVFKEIVKRAKAANLRTAVHVETVQDLRLAVEAGATEASHLPAYNLTIAKDELSSRIPDDLIAQMAAQGFITVTTVNVSTRRKYSAEDYAIVAQRQADNLRRMQAAGAPIAIGSDVYFGGVSDEVKTLRKMKAFRDVELLKLWIDTPRLSIFPQRAIGELEPGFEASFLALACDPIANFDCVAKIEERYKQGAELKLE